MTATFRHNTSAGPQLSSLNCMDGGQEKSQSGKPTSADGRFDDARIARHSVLAVYIFRDVQCVAAHSIVWTDKSQVCQDASILSSAIECGFHGCVGQEHLACHLQDHLFAVRPEIWDDRCEALNPMQLPMLEDRLQRSVRHE